MSKVCAICGKPLDGGVVVHQGCVLKWVRTKKNLPPKCREVFLYDEELKVYGFGCWTGREWDWDGGFSSTEARNYWSHWAIPVPPKEDKS